jgi:putative addiction module component (TIGR02574 family)
MTKIIEKEFRSLTVAERVDLVGELWEQISVSPETLSVPQWQMDELERRRQLYKSNPKRAIPWAEAKTTILKQHAKRRRPA